MASNSESGHAKNVANFEQLTVNCSGLGTNYNPSNASIKSAALTTLLTSAKSSVSAVNAAYATWSNAVAAREVAFATLSKLTTRIYNALKASGTTHQMDESAKSFVRKIQGRRATPKATEEERKLAETNGKPIVQVSSSQMGYDNRIDNLDKLIKLLGTITLYAPNELDLKVATLTTFLNDLKAKNLAVVSADTALANARIARNAILYKIDSGLVDISSFVKTYIKSIYGASSPQYKQVSCLRFKSFNN